MTRLRQLWNDVQQGRFMAFADLRHRIRPRRQAALERAMTRRGYARAWDRLGWSLHGL